MNETELILFMQIRLLGDEAVFEEVKGFLKAKGAAL